MEMVQSNMQQSESSNAVMPGGADAMDSDYNGDGVDKDLGLAAAMMNSPASFAAALNQRFASAFMPTRPDAPKSTFSLGGGGAEMRPMSFNLSALARPDLIGSITSMGQNRKSEEDRHGHASNDQGAIHGSSSGLQSAGERIGGGMQRGLDAVRGVIGARPTFGVGAGTNFTDPASSSSSSSSESPSNSPFKSTTGASTAAPMFDFSRLGGGGEGGRSTEPVSKPVSGSTLLGKMGSLFGKKS